MEDLTTKILSQPNEELKKIYANYFLSNYWLPFNPYREHLAKNFDDKIFFFEPINKFYDLLWVKKIAFRQLLKCQEFVE